MSREIKFRAWDKEYKEYNHESPIALSLEGELYAVWAYHPQKITSNRYVIEQYTGLKDKNGKKIYEGDIITAFVGVVQVVYCQEWGQFVFAQKDGSIGTCEDFVHWSSRDVEVIGNIHENPELLGGEK